MSDPVVPQDAQSLSCLLLLLFLASLAGWSGPTNYHSSLTPTTYLHLLMGRPRSTYCLKNKQKTSKTNSELFYLTINLIKFYFAGRRYQSLQHWKKQPRSNIRLNFHQLYFLLANSNSSGFQELWRAGRNMHLNFNQLDGFNAHFNLWFPSFLKRFLFSTHLWARYFMMTK